MSLEEECLQQMIEPLMEWYRRQHRDLPWRRNPAPYHVWLSEIMLQQTRVEAVIPYYERFLEALPGIRALAEVSDEELMKLWQGLGYYSRARNLKKAAQIAVEQYDGQLPADYKKLLKLPGIGSYTAGAVASIAFGIPKPAVDGNVLRVISRLLALEEDIRLPKVKKDMEVQLEAIMPKDAPGDFNQALMELGAVVCIPNGEPRCSECPLLGICQAKARDLTGQIPYKAPKKPRKIEDRTILLIRYKDSYAMEKRPSKGLLAGLYEFVNLEGSFTGEKLTEYLIGQGETAFTVKHLPDSKHVFSHVEWRMQAYYVLLKARKGKQFTYYSRKDILEQLAVPSAFSAYLRILEQEEK